MDLGRAGLRIFQLQSDQADELHGHDNEYQISLPLSGRLLMQLNDKIRPVDIGDRLMVCPHDRHRHIATGQTVQIMLVGIDRPFIEQVAAEQLGIQQGTIDFARWDEGTIDPFRKLAEAAFATTMYGGGDLLKLQELELEVAHLFLSLQRGNQTERYHRSLPYVQHPALKRAIEMIYDDYTTDLSLDRLAMEVNVSKFHLIHLFREQVGVTPSQFVNHVRLERAEWLLVHSMMDITAIAFEVGFGSLSAFQRAFKKKYGASASEYRQQFFS